MAKYCIFSAQYLPSFGGVEQYTYNLASKLRQRGNEVIIVTSQLNHLPLEETDDNGIIIYRIPSINCMNGRLPIAAYSDVWRRLKITLSKSKIDRIIIQTRLYTLSIMGMHFAKKNRIPCITIEHGTSFVGMSNPVIQFAEIAYEKLLLVFAKHYCKHFCTVSVAGSEWLKHLHINAIEVLYNSVDEKIIEQYIKQTKTDWREKESLSPDTKLIVFTGRLIREKGILQLIDAVAALQKEMNVALLIAGDGPLFLQLKEQIKTQKNIFLLGRLEQSEVMSLLKNGNIFCLPSDSEGFPTSVLEAIVCKCFVVTSPYGGAKEIISSPQYGKVMEDNSEKSIYLSIKEIFEKPDSEISKITGQAYQHFLTSFTWDNTCDRLEALEWNKFV